MLQWVGPPCKDSCHLRKPTEKHRSNARFLEYFFIHNVNSKVGKHLEIFHTG